MFGKDTHEIKGNTARSNPHEVTTTHYDLPTQVIKKFKDVTTLEEIFFVNRMSMLTSRSDKIKILAVSFMENRTKRTRFNSLKTVANMCDMKGFKVRVMKDDGEFEDLIEPFAALELDVDMSITSKDEHVGKIEMIVRVVK